MRSNVVIVVFTLLAIGAGARLAPRSSGQTPPEPSPAPVAPVESAAPGDPPMRVDLTADALEVDGARQVLTGSVRAVLGGGGDAAPALVVRAARAVREGRRVTLEGGVVAESTTTGSGPGAPLEAWMYGRQVVADRVTLRAERVTFDEVAQVVTIDAPVATASGDPRGPLDVKARAARIVIARGEDGAWRLKGEGLDLTLVCPPR